MKYQSILETFTPASIFILVMAVPISAVLISACVTSDEELRDGARERAREDMVTIKPRPGVECYVLRGATAANPRSMSCVTIPNTTQEAR